MNRLATLLAKTEPENAVLLRRAYQQAKEDFILKDMDAILKFLETEKLDEAVQKQKDVEESLQKLLLLLLDKEDDLEDLIKKIKRLESYQKELERLIKEETAEKKDSDDASSTTDKLKDIAEAKKALDDLIQRQEKQVASTEALGGAVAPKTAEAFESLRASQEDIREATEELAFKVDEVLGKGGDGEPTESKTGEALGQSAESMAKAEGSLSEQEQESALSKEQKALDQLKEAKKALAAEEKEARKLLSLPDFEELEETQDSTKGDTDALAKKMEEEGGEQGTPGQGSVQKAGGSMGKASGNLSKKSPKKASRNQQEALDQLQQAKDEVEDALEQARRELQEEVLALLEERFRHMLAQQKEISRKTIAMDTALGGNAPDRAQKQAISELSKGETDLADQSDEALELLVEEGSTVVFPEVVKGMKQDLFNVAGLLASTRTDELTQAIQKEIEETLEELIEAVRKKQEHAGNCEGGGCCSGDAPLLPASAEVKMIRSLQIRVNKRTTAFDLDRDPKVEDALPKIKKEQVDRIAKKQESVENLTRTMAEKLNREE
ncbi:MAG: hypothetical protein O7H41_05015 [Planctomycetota bacterium]|nr:hypothetical protein [Planctomycetota bacterium]